MILTVLNAQEEERIRKEMTEKARLKCTKYLDELFACTRHKTVSLLWNCKKEVHAANECVKQYTKDEVHRKMRLDMLNDKTEYLKKNGKYPEE
ncbi:hypothetical protein HDV06_005974 [Boothiomyces sp. JEL0866]|nr:hypothetical protein HDV06_005974 [Boothiomyces sp. JEL0866]